MAPYKSTSMLADSSFSNLNNSLETPRVDWSDRLRHDALLDQAQALVGVMYLFAVSHASYRIHTLMKDTLSFMYALQKVTDFASWD